MRKKKFRVVLSAALILAMLSAGVTALASGGDGAAETYTATSASLTAAAATGASLNHFQARVSYGAGTFSDIGAGEWFDSSVQKAYELGIMSGRGEGVFDPTGNIRISEALKMACVVRDIYSGGTGEFTQTGDVWYSVYIDFALQNGILSASEFADYDAYATRAQMACLFERALPDSELDPINTVETLPDVDQNTPYAASIFALYRAGILTGNDSAGTFAPETYITRAQAAAIITREAVREERKAFVLTSSSASGKEAVVLSILDRCSATQESLGGCEAVLRDLGHGVF